ncbi:MAG: alpha/beta hydrolase [Bifidobacteriaceae bacterium]|jgi:lysophospholipase|nr:alpha/beta hydrolase [Bifidobacteriaceae bacterium]
MADLNQHIVPIPETDYARTMEKTVMPALATCRHDDWYTVERESVPLKIPDAESHRSQGIHSVFYDVAEFGAAAESALGTIVISHGFTEAAVKYSELTWYFLRAGFNVLIIEHRGHGASLRENSDPTVVSIDDWRHYVTDFVGALDQARHRFSLDEAGPLFLFAHSLGGAIGAAVVETHPDVFAKAVLSSPMLMPQVGMPLGVAYAMASAAVTLGHGTDKVPTLPVFSEEPGKNKSGARSTARAEWYFAQRVNDWRYRTSAPSLNWVKAALDLDTAVLSTEAIAAIRTPILLFQAGDDHWVRPSAQNLFVKRARAAGVPIRFLHAAGSTHEIFSEPNDVLEPYLNEILRFYRRSVAETGC